MIKFLIVLIIFIFSTVISIPQSLAQESANSTGQYALQLKQLKQEGAGKIETVTYGIFYVTSKDQCDDSDRKRLGFYQVITDEYLSLYSLDHNQDSAACISEKDFYKYFSKISPTVIPIVIVDENAGQKLLIQEGNNGLYTISGIGSESILVCACDNDIESWSGAWILSHELSHLSLYRYKAPESVYFTWVHYIEAMSYACKMISQSKFCPEYSTTITAPSGNQIPVMEIFGQGATAYNMPPSPPQIDVPVIQKSIPIPKDVLTKAIQIQVLPPKPALDIISSVNVVGLKPLNIDGRIYSVPYNITGGIVQGLDVDSVTRKLTVGIIGGENGGQLQLQLSRKIMDSVQDGKDMRFVVNIASGDNSTRTQLDYVETQTNTEMRTLMFDFPQDSSVIEITGTVIVPEFPFAIPILVIGITSLVIVYRLKLSSAKI